MYDILIRSAQVFDGSGKPRFISDVAVKDGKIVLVGDAGSCESALTINASGLAVMPGFVDAHSHSDLTLPVHHKGISQITQGITTEVAGSCGWGLAPCTTENIQSVMKYFTWAMPPVDVDSLTWEWRSFADYHAFLEKKGIGANLIPILGQSIIRSHVVGTENRAASKGEIRAMCELVREAMEEGARGLSAGRSYEPGCFGDIAEIIELCKVVAQFDGVYTVHLKSEGEGLFDALLESIEIGRRSGAAVEVSHHKTIGKANAGKSVRTLEMMEEARAEGIRISCDVYPYNYSQISLLYRTFPRKYGRMSREELKASLASPAFRDELRAEFARGNRKGLTAGNDQIIIYCPARPDLEWKSYAEVAGGRDMLDAACDLLLEADMEVRVCSYINEEDVQSVVKHPMTAIGTDAWALDRDMGNDFAVHPRHFGSFARAVGHYARDKKLTTMEEMVRKTTSMPARKFGISDRGMVSEGYRADLLVVNPETFVDTAVPGNPYSPPAGLDYVIVNGQVAMDHGAYKPVLAGKVLYR